MNQNINAGRMRHYVEVFETNDVQDENGEITEATVFVFDARADVLVRRGDESQNYGTVVSSSMITVLMWYDARLIEDMSVKWNNFTYRVKHIEPDREFKSMIATCEVIK